MRWFNGLVFVSLLFFLISFVCANDAYNPLCTYDSDCISGYVCDGGECVFDTSVACINSSTCLSEEKCFSSKCVPVDCDVGFVPQNHECVCAGTVCGKFCFEGKGVCCDTTWKPNASSCSGGIIGTLLDGFFSIFKIIFGIFG